MEWNGRRLIGKKGGGRAYVDLGDCVICIDVGYDHGEQGGLLGRREDHCWEVVVVGLWWGQWFLQRGLRERVTKCVDIST
jgi:hypothetical protein